MFTHTKAFSSFSVDDISKAKNFYGSILGLAVKEEYGGLSVAIEGSSNLMIYPKDTHEPATYTVLNFPVKDIEKTVDELISKGVTFEQYDYLHTDAKGISRSDQVNMAWFKDPAGNILAVMQ